MQFTLSVHAYKQFIHERVKQDEQMYQGESRPTHLTLAIEDGV